MNAQAMAELARQRCYRDGGKTNKECENEYFSTLSLWIALNC